MGKIFLLAILNMAVISLAASPCMDKPVQYFWPPDMVPHPTPPGSGPEDRNESDMC